MEQPQIDAAGFAIRAHAAIAEAAIAENADFRARLAAAERDRDEALAQRNEAQGERNEAWRERDEAIRQRDGEHKIVVRYEMLTVQKELRALIASQSAALAKMREALQPFAAYAPFIDHRQDHEAILSANPARLEWVHVTAGDFREALAAIDALTERQGIPNAKTAPPA